jgi:hypothetical protein
MGSSVERTYQLGVRYLVMATDPKAGGYDSMYGEHGRFEDNSCTGTQPYVAQLARFRPSPHLPLPNKTEVEASSDGPIGTWVLVLGGLALCAVGAGALRRRHRSAA